MTARDEAFFKNLFFSGDRGKDIGQFKTQEIARFPDDSGFLFNHIWREDAERSSNLFCMRRQCCAQLRLLSLM